MHLEAAKLDIPPYATLMTRDDLHHRRLAYQNGIRTRHAIANHVVNHRRGTQTPDFFIVAKRNLQRSFQRAFCSQPHRK